MKKNVMMRIASILLVCVLVTTCGISGTFAKYVTEYTSDDEARVAKFGVTIETGGSLFSDSYKDTATDYTANEKLNTITVQAAAENTNVIAPGTQGELAMFSVTGTPEVDVRVSYKADLSFGGNWLVDYNDDEIDDLYCPIVITVKYGDNTEVFTMAGHSTLAAFEEAVETFINNSAVVYHTNTDLSAVNDDLTVSWRWYFEADTAGNPLSAYQNDNADTDLGDAAVEGDITISLNITCTITQID